MRTVLAVVLALAVAAAADDMIHAVYTGSDGLLLMHSKDPRMGQVHQMQRLMRAPTCDYVVHPARSDDVGLDDAVHRVASEWDDLRATWLGKSVIFAQDASSGQYVVRNCTQPESSRDPCPIYASGVDLATAGNKVVYYAGPHRVLVHDVTTGGYQMLFFDADVHGSGSIFHHNEGAIFSGGMDEVGPVDFVYINIGSKDLMLLHMVDDGRITVYEYNARASRASEMFGAKLAEGRIVSREFMVVPLDKGDVLVYSQPTARFEIWRFSVAEDSTINFAVIETGNLTQGYPCGAQRTPRTCAAIPTCGWCLGDSACHQMAGDREFCEGGFCAPPPLETLNHEERNPELYGYGKNEAPTIETYIPPYEREIEPPLEGPGPRVEKLPDEYDERQTHIHELDAAVVADAGDLIGGTVEGQKIQQFFRPPRTAAEPCMNAQHKEVVVRRADARIMDIVKLSNFVNVRQSSDLDATKGSGNQMPLNERSNCTRTHGKANAESTVTHTALQPEIRPSDKTQDVLTPFNLEHPLKTMEDEYMNSFPGHGLGIEEEEPVDTNIIPHAEDIRKGGHWADSELPTDTMNDGVPCGPFDKNVRKEKLTPIINNAPDPNAEIMEGAMNNAVYGVWQNIPDVLADEPPRLHQAYSPTPSPSPSPSSYPSASPSTSPSPSVTPVASPTPTHRPMPCYRNALIMNDELRCGQCGVFWWTPSDLTKHLLPKDDTDHTHNKNCDGEIDLLQYDDGADVDEASGPRGAPQDGTDAVPEVDDDIVKESDKAEPRPPVPEPKAKAKHA